MRRALLHKVSTSIRLPVIYRRLYRHPTMTVSKNTRSRGGKRNPNNEPASQAMNSLSSVKLSQEQQRLRDTVLEFVRKAVSDYEPAKGPAMFVIQGDAGTGKSVVLNSLFNEMQRVSSEGADTDSLSGTNNYLVVNHPEMLKLYLRICRSFPFISRTSLERPTSLINRLHKEKALADIVIVDEAHLLSTSKDAYKRFYGENHLEDLMGIAKALVIVYDTKQSLRMGSYWEDGDTNGASLAHFYERVPPEMRGWHTLQEQFRVVAPDDVLDWISEISTVGTIPPYPKSALPGNKGSNGFEFKIWEDIGAMYAKLRELNDEYGQCRMLCTYDFPYRLDGKDYFVTCGDNFKVRWDRYKPKIQIPWSERADTIDEVGSVYTIQGFDLNYAGVILGRSVKYDKVNDAIRLDIKLYDDRAGFTTKKNIKNPDDVKQKIIMNSINVLLTRGVKGLYVYAWDKELRERLTKGIPQ